MTMRINSIIFVSIWLSIYLVRFMDKAKKKRSYCSHLRFTSDPFNEAIYVYVLDSVHWKRWWFGLFFIGASTFILFFSACIAEVYSHVNAFIHSHLIDSFQCYMYWSNVGKFMASLLVCSLFSDISKSDVYIIFE